MLRAKNFRSFAASSLSGKWGSVYLKILLCASIGLVFSILSSFLYPMPSLTEIMSDPQFFFTYLLADFRKAQLITLIGTVITMGIAITQSWIYLQVAKNNNPDWQGFGAGLKRFFESFVFSLILTIRIFLWTLLFIIPGIIKAFSYSMAIFIKIENPQMSCNQAINASNEMMKGNKWRLFCLLFSFIGWWFLSGLVVSLITMFIPLPFLSTALNFLVPLLVTIYSQTAVAHFYMDLKNTTLYSDKTVTAA